MTFEAINGAPLGQVEFNARLRVSEADLDPVPGAQQVDLGLVKE
jgi:hypothetical protein